MEYVQFNGAIDDIHVYDVYVYDHEPIVIITGWEFSWSSYIVIPREIGP
jgi:hypothetical protein